MSESVMLKIEGLQVSVDGKKILNGLDLEVKAGEVHAIMGPNGSRSEERRVGKECKP